MQIKEELFLSDNNFTLDIIATLNKQLSKAKLKNDLKAIDNSLSVKVIAKLATMLSKKQLRDSLKQLNNLYVQVGAKFKTDKSTKNKLLNEIEQLQKNLTELQLRVNVEKGISQNAISSVITTAKMAQQYADKTSITLDVEVRKEKAINDILYIGQKYSKLFSNISASQKYENLLNSAYSISDKSQLQEVRAQISAFTSDLKAHGLAVQSVGDKWRKLTERAKDLFSAASIVRMVFSQTKQAVSTTIDLDKVYTDLVKVNDELNRNDYANYLSKCNQKAQELATTQKSLIEGAAEFSKSGYDLDTSNKLTEKSTVLSNVGEMSAADSAKAIISGVQAYDEIGGYTDTIDKATALIDRYNELGNTASITTAELAQGVQSVGSVFADANTSVDQFLSLLSAGNRQYQNADSLALALRTSALRIRGASVELEQAGEDIEGVMSVLDNQKAIKALTGVDILEKDQKTIRSIYDIFLDISKVYKDMSDVDQSALLDILAGKHRASAISATLNNMTEAEEILQNSLHAAGSAQREYDSYLESTEAHIQQFQSKLVETYTTFMNGDMISHAADLGTAVLDLVNKTDLLKHSLIAITAIKVGQGISAIGGVIASTTQQLNILGSALQKVKELPLDDVLRENALKQIGEETKNLTEKNLKLLLSQKQLGESDRKIILGKHNLTKEQAAEKLEKMGLTNATNANTAANTANAASTNTLKGAFTGLTASIKATWVAMSALEKASVILAAVSTVISVGKMIFSGFNQAVEETRQKAQELGNTFSSTEKDIDSYKAKISELYATINDSDSSIEDVTTARKNLMEVQDELIEKFGDEKETIDLITQAIYGQTKALDELTNKQWQEVKNDFNNGDFWNDAGNFFNGYDDNIDRMLSEYGNYNVTIDLSKYGGKLFTEGYDDFKQTAIDDFGAEVSAVGSEYLELSGTASEVHQKLLDIQSLINDTSEFKPKDNFNTYLGELANSAKEVSTQYEQMYDQYILYEKVFNDNDYTQSFKDINEKYKEYEEAFASGDSEKIDKAIENYSVMVASAMNAALQNGDTEVAEYFENMYPTLQSIVEQWEFKTKVIPTFDTSGLKGKKETDILAMLETDGIQEGEEIFNSIVASAKEYGLITDDNAKGIQKVLDLLVEWGILQGEISDAAGDTNTEILSTTEILSQIQSLSKGLDQLDKIYADIYNKGDFDWSSILNNDGFKEAFGELGQVYDDFIETISNSPNDISACQSAFNNLATSYIYNSGVLDNLTEETKASTVAMLEQMGVANATGMVEARLAAQKEITAKCSKELSELTLAEIAAIIKEGIVSEETAGYLQSMAIEKIAVNGVTINSEADVNNILAIAKAAGMGAIELAKLKNALNEINSSGSSKMPLGASDLLTGNSNKESNNPLEEKLKKKKEQEKNNPLLVDNSDNKNAEDKVSDIFKKLRDEMASLNEYDYFGNFTGGSTTQKAIDDAAKSAKDAAKSTKDAADTVKEAVAETFDFIENGIDLFEKNLSKLEDKANNTGKSFKSRAQAYEEALKGVSFGMELLSDDYNKYMAKANSIGLDESIAQKIRGGDSNIWDYTDDNLKQQIKDYETWYKKAQGCLDKIEELKQKQVELSQQSIELIITQYEKYSTKVENANNRMEKWISLKEAWGFSGNTDNYNSMNKNIQKQIGYVLQQDELLKKLQKTVTKGSEAWYEYNERIDANKSTLYELKQQMVENAKAAAELAKATADKKADKYSQKNELHDAKIDTAISAKKKNSFIDKKISNINNTQSAYNDAVATDTTNLKKAKKTLNNFKSTKENKSILSEIKKKIKAGKRITQSLLKKASKLDDNGKLYKACLEYNAYFDAKEADKQIAELYKETSKQEKATLAQEKFDNIASEYDYGISGNEQKKTSINNKISLAETQGKRVSTAYYDGLISAESGEQQKLIQKRNALQKSLNEAVINGYVKEGSEEWYAMVDAINEVTNSIDESTKSLVQFHNEQRQIKWDAFDDALETVGRINSEADYYIDLMSNKDMVDKDSGKFTEYGTATLGLHQTNYENYLAQANAYQNEYNSLMDKIAKGEESIADENVIKRLRELQDGHRNAKLSAENELQAIQDLVKQGYESQLDILSKLIDKYKKLKDSELDAYKYQKEIAEKTKNIAALQKQLSAYGNNDTEEARAQIQKLKVELQDAQNDLKDTEYEKFISDTETMLDDLFNDYEAFIDDKINSTDTLLTDIKALLGGENGSIISILKALDPNLTQTLENTVNGNTNAQDYTNNEVANEQANVNQPVDNSGYDAAAAAAAAEAEAKRQAEEAAAAQREKERQENEQKRARLEQSMQMILADISKLEEELESIDKEEEEYKKAKKDKKNKGKFFAVRDWASLRKTINKKLNKRMADLNKIDAELASIPQYEKGSSHISKKQLAWTQENGKEMIYRASDGAMLTPLNAGDKVFTNEMSQRLWEMAQMNPHLFNVPNVASNSIQTTLPAFERNVSTGDVNISFGDITLPDVTNSAEFVDSVENVMRGAVCKNGKTLKCLTEAVSSQQLGKGIGKARMYRN